MHMHGHKHAVFHWFHLQHGIPSIGRSTLCYAQALHQLAGLGSTLVIAICGGLLVGMLVKYSDCASQKMSAEHFYEDAVFWHEVMEEEGELGHTVANGQA